MSRQRLIIVVLLAGNFVVATCAIMLLALVPDLSHALNATPVQAGQLITLSGLVMCVVAPAAGVLAKRINRQRLLCGALLVQGLALLLAVTQTTLSGLLVARVFQVIGPAIFTAQAAAALPKLVPKEQIGSATASIYLGWPLALVLGMPAATWISGHWGWTTVFLSLGVLTLTTATLVWLVLPNQLQPLSVQPNAHTQPALAGLWSCLITTGFANAAQLTVLAYFTTYAKHVLGVDSTSIALSLLGLGVLGTIGVGLVGKAIDRLGASQATLICLSLMAISMLAWPLATTLPLAALVLTPWALSAFALNATQQARLVKMKPEDGSRTVGLNTAFVYLGQALGSALGGYWVAHIGFTSLGTGALLLIAFAGIASYLSTRASTPNLQRHGHRVDPVQR